MREVGIVKDIEEKIVVVGIEMHEGCESCINSSCKAGRSALKTYNAKDLELVPGDEVEIEVKSIEQARGAFWVLGLPLIALFLGYGIGFLFFPSTSEAPAVASAGLFFAIAMAVGLGIQKRRKFDALPVVLRKIEGLSSQS
jgi:positive regulator of sigma E activity